MNTEQNQDITPLQAVEVILASKDADGVYDMEKVDGVIAQLNDVEHRRDQREFLDDVTSIVDHHAGSFLPEKTYTLTGQQIMAACNGVAKDILELIDGDETDNSGYVLRVKGEGYGTPDISGELAVLFDSVNS